MENKLEKLIEKKERLESGKMEITRCGTYTVLYWDVIDGMKDVSIVYDKETGEIFPNLGDKNNIKINKGNGDILEMASPYWYKLK